MAWFGQGKDTIEWNEFRPDVLFYKWPNNEIKKGSKLIIRPGQKAIFYSGGCINGIFEDEGSFDIQSEIVPFLSTLQGIVKLRGDSGIRAEIYFINSKELLLRWGTKQRIMIPTPEVASGVPVGCNGNMIIGFSDYLKFITNVAGVKSTYTLQDISERILGEMNAVLAEAILNGQTQVGLNVLFELQRNSRSLGKIIAAELDKELFDFGLSVKDVNINSFNYPPEVQKMAEKVASQSFVTDTGKFAAVNLAESFNQPGNGNNPAAFAAQMAMGMQMAQQMTQQNQQSFSQTAAPGKGGGSWQCTGCGQSFAQAVKFCPECGKEVQQATGTVGGDRFCPNCRKMVSGKFCSECGTATV